jgi:hypothetical protein
MPPEIQPGWSGSKRWHTIRGCITNPTSTTIATITGTA